MNNKFFFLDLETTGLNERECSILEVAAVITDHKLKILEEYSAVVWAPPEELAKMDDWCRTTHTQSGLLHDIKDKAELLEEVELDLIKLKRKHFPVDRPPLAGSSVHFDKRFIDQHLPVFSKELSHRIIDVSTFMGALDNYYGFKLPSRSEATHRALADVNDSIAYLRQYLENFRG
jgi:oligoribonuclease